MIPQRVLSVGASIFEHVGYDTSSWSRRVAISLTIATIGLLVLSQRALAQSGVDICSNEIVVALENLLNLAMALGPIVGAVMASVSMIFLTRTVNPEEKQVWISRRNDAIIYGVGILFVVAIFRLLIGVTGSSVAACF